MPSKPRMFLRTFFTRFAFSSGIAAAIWRLFWRGRVAVLLDHDPSPQSLDAHLMYLKTVCDIVPFSKVNARGRGRRRAAITLDDGHVRNAELLPVFIKPNVRQTIFICSSIVGQARAHWWLHPGVAHLGVERLKTMRNVERLGRLQSAGFMQHAAAEESQGSGLSAEQVQAMRRYVDFESHTRFHPIPTRCDDAECRDYSDRKRRSRRCSVAPAIISLTIFDICARVVGSPDANRSFEPG
ncbi:polysaccharide deacetylase family protein [Paraburkholderia sp. BR14374]|uniref:polysaccharide deacetylase family protein n=1 Tax=Paraburkholderia sp. BR14374 TaxID=3237007 RepID=UPI0034CED134